MNILTAREQRCDGSVSIMSLLQQTIKRPGSKRKIERNTGWQTDTHTHTQTVIERKRGIVLRKREMIKEGKRLKERRLGRKRGL